MRKDNFIKLLIISIIGFVTIAFIAIIFLPKSEHKILEGYEIPGEGKIAAAITSKNGAFAFVRTSSDYMPALIYRDSSSRWKLLGKGNQLVSIESRRPAYKRAALNFAEVKREKDRLVARTTLRAPDGNLYDVLLSVWRESWDGKNVFVLDYFWQNKGPKDSNEVTIPTAIQVKINPKKSYYFSPGIFYKNNELEPEGATTDVDIPRLSKLLKDKYYTFLANRPMLPLVANWDEESKFMVMMGTTDTTLIGDTLVRNSLGWRVNGNILEQITWTHGYLFNRYAGPDEWTESVDKDTEAKKSIRKGEHLRKRFYIAFDQGDVLRIFDYYKVFREHYRANQRSTVYESMYSSFKKRVANLGDFYNDKEGYFLSHPGAKNQMPVSWIGGASAAYGLILLADYIDNAELRTRANSAMDFIASNSLSPSGFGYPVYQDGVWSYKGVVGWSLDPRYQRVGIPSRIASEATFFMLRAYQYEAERGRLHENWLNYATSNLDAAVEVWNKFGEFGYAYSDSTPTIKMLGTPSGILWIGDLALGYKITGNKQYLDAAVRSADYYYKNFLSKGLLYGGELDQRYSPDASSAAHAMAAYYTLFETTGDRRYLSYSKKAADIFSTYVMGVNIKFDSLSWSGIKGWTSLGLSTSGVRNNHISSGNWPGFTEYLVYLYEKTGEVYYLQVASDQYRASLEAYARNDSDFKNVKGAGEIKTGYGFDWILHSDWGPKWAWFGGVMHPGMLHQTYVPALTWIPVFTNYGNIIIDYRSKVAVSIDSLELQRVRFGSESIELIARNSGANDDVFKLFVQGLPSGQYVILKNKFKLEEVKIASNEPIVIKVKQRAGQQDVLEIVRK